jgi:putative phosphoribosyl transferase
MRTTLAVPAGGLELPGDLVVPDRAVGVVAFAHGSGSSRQSPRNRFVAGELERAGLATLLFDLLTPTEETDRRNVFDVAMLGARLGDAVGLLRELPQTQHLPVGLFGASTGAAAAVIAAAAPANPVQAVVSRGGRPDLADEFLQNVRAPVLLIVGSLDTQVLAWNRAAAAQLETDHRIEVVSGASHLFEEPGTLEAVAGLARDWFLRHLAGAASASSGA